MASQGQQSGLCPLPAACLPAVFQHLVGKIHLCRNFGAWVRSDVFHLGTTRRHPSHSPGFAMCKIISLPHTEPMWSLPRFHHSFFLLSARVLAHVKFWPLAPPKVFHGCWTTRKLCGEVCTPLSCGAQNSEGSPMAHRAITSGCTEQERGLGNSSVHTKSLWCRMIMRHKSIFRHR